MYKDPEKVKLKNELNKLKASGQAPQWLTWMGFQKLKGGYLWKNETPRGMYERVARSAAKYLPEDQKDWENKFFNLFWKNWLAGSTPVLGNIGTDRGMPVSCSAQFCGDSLQDIMYNAYESGMLSKYGFGTAVYFDVRDGYSPISTGGHSNNVKDWIEQQWFIQNKVTQSNLRRGSTAMYIDFWHGDLFDILPMLETHDRLHLGIVCDDTVKAKLKNNDEDALRRYKTILSWRAKKGKPYIIFIDNAKRQDPDTYKKLGLSSKHSNLCVAPETKILTSEGYKEIKTLQDKTIKVWNGEQWSETVVRKTGTKQKLLKVKFNNGEELECTPYHKFYIQDGTDISRVTTSSLKKNDKLITFKIPNEDNLQNIEVLDIIDEERTDDTFCFTEPLRGMGVFNGVLTGNCSEIFLHTDNRHTLSCVLSSMNCTTYDEWKDTDAVETAVVFLDCVAEDLIQRAKGIKGLEKVVRHTIRGRALGLGLLGFHTYLQNKMIPIDSVQARGNNHLIFKNIKEKAEKATKMLAEWLGEPEWCKGSGRRNTHLLAVAPNTSSALIAGSTSQGIEPIVANVYTQKTAKGTVDRINPELLKLLRKKEKYTEEVVDSIAYAKGSVQHLDFLTDDEKQVFKTAYEINQKVLIDLAEQRQEHICQGQSLNLFFDANEEEEWIHECHRHAFEQKRLKSLYYVRTMAGITADKEECIVCEG